MTEYEVSFTVNSLSGVLCKNPVLNSDHMCLWWSKPAYDQKAKTPIGKWDEKFCRPASAVVQKRKQVRGTSLKHEQLP